MQYLDKGNNNPANPLVKAVALELSKNYVKNDGINKEIDVIAKLNFKHSNDFTGVTTDRNGMKVSVNFSLAIKRATFRLKYALIGKAAHQNFRVQKIPFISPLMKSISTTTKYKRGQKQHFNIIRGLFGKLKLKTSRTNDSSLGVDLELSKQTSNNEILTYNEESHSQFFNINGTHARGCTHWEIEALDPHQQNPLVGEVFFNKNKDDDLSAGSISWRDKQDCLELEVLGSVRVKMPDLILQNINFYDNDGESIKLTNLSSSKKFPLFNKDEFKQRLAKQIIRKHLSNSGMEIDGVNVEVCCAHA